MSKNNSKLIRKALVVYILITMLIGNLTFFSMQSKAPAIEQLIEKNEVNGGGDGLKVHINNNLAQCFYASGTYTITKVSLYIKDEVPVDDSLTVQIYDNNNNGTPADPNDDVPGNPLGASANANGPNDFFAWVDFSFSVGVNKGGRYWIVASSAQGVNQGYRWMDSNGDRYVNGYAARQAIPNWVVDLDNDLMFRVYGETSNNDVGVEEIIAPEHQEMYHKINITSIIQNYGPNNQGSFDVRCVIKDPSGAEIFNDTQTINSLDSGAATNLTWSFVPVLEGTYTINITTLLSGDVFDANNKKSINIKVQTAGILKLHDEITIDGLYNDWYGEPLSIEDTWHVSRREYIWNDAENDDNGDGDYEYPRVTSPPPANFRFESGCLDLREFRVAVDSNSINFLLQFGSIDDGFANDGTDGPLGFSEQIIEILIDMDRDGTGRDDGLRNARLKIDPDIGWEYALWADGWGNGYLMDEFGNTYSGLSARGSPLQNAVEISIPAISGDLIPDFDVWRYFVLIGAQDDNSLPYPIKGSRSGFMNVDATASETGGGGGQDGNGADPNVYDLAFASSQPDQLDDYGSLDLKFASFTDTSGATGGNIDLAENWAQSFSPSTTCLLSGVDIYAMDIGADSLGMNISIQSNNDKGTSDPTDDEPSGIKISSTEQMDFAINYEWKNIPFSNPAVIREGETYWIVATASDPGSQGYLWGRKSGDPWPGGVSARFFSSIWSQQADDMLFNATYRELTTLDAYQSVYFAPIVINIVCSNGSIEKEYINIYYNGTVNAPLLNMNTWTLTDQDGNVFQFENFALNNKNSITLHTGSGMNTSEHLWWSRIQEVWHDRGDDVLLNSSLTVPVDFMNYTDGIIFGNAPPKGLDWGPEGTEDIPANPKNLQALSLIIYGRENDFYSDWGMKALGIIENKTLYLHDDKSFNANDPYDFMDTIPPTETTLIDFDGDGDPGLTLKRVGASAHPLRFQEFNVTPRLAKDFNIADDVVVDLWFDYSGKGDQWTIIVTLYDFNGTTKTQIATESKVFLIDGNEGWELVSITLPDLIYTVEKGHNLSLHITTGTTTANKDLWMAYNTTDQRSCIRILPTQTFVNVDWIKTYDIAEIEKSNFILDQEVIIKANISDPLGSHDIAGANITIILPGGSVSVLNQPMTLIAIDMNKPSAWKLFNFTFSNTNESGVYTIIVKGIESNGVTHTLITYFNILESTPPILTDPSLIPSTGDALTTFNFTINYSDMENHPPGVVMVNITGLGTFPMFALNPGDVNYKDGKLYYAVLTGFVNSTSYSYHFAASDSKGLWTETSEFFGPNIINTPPELINPNLIPIIGNASTSFNYTVNYIDIDNHPPDVITVNITGPSHQGSWAMIELDPSDTNYKDGKLYYYQYTGLFYGVYSYHFAANDSQGAWFEAGELLGPQVLNTPPVLVNPGVAPGVGYVNTKFNYTVTYIDLDNQAPAEITVNISGPSHAGSWIMVEVDPLDTNYRDGKEYYYSFTGLIIGSYTFHFSGKDTQNAWAETSELPGPNVLNSRPILTNYYLEPPAGFANITVFNYTVTYIDLDNQAPGNIKLNITGPFTGNFTMNESDPSDTDYTDGKDYYYTITFPFNGTYGFVITANDTGGLWAIPIVDIGPVIGGTKPLLSLPMVEPVIGITTTWFNFTVKYTHPENRPVGEILLNLTGPTTGIFKMDEVDPSDINTNDGKYFYINVTGLKKGLYSFNVEGTDDLNVAAIASKYVNAPEVLNTLPQLSGSYINESNYGNSWFNFSLNYKDIDNDSAGNVNVNIMGIGNFTMIEVDPSDNIWSDGKEYYYNISIPKGSYQYRFEALDTGFRSGWNFTILKWIDLINNIPIFSEPKVTPSTGYGGEYFNFTVNMYDYDNDILDLISYIIGEPGSPFIMQELDVGDTDTIDGKIYFYNLTLAKGTYNYNFSVFDGEVSNQTLPLLLVVSNNPPIITTLDIENTLEDSPYTVDYDSIDLDLDLVTWSLETNASWLNIITGTGLLEGTPNNLDVGSYYVNVSVEDGDGGIDYHNFTLEVINTLPTITTIPTIIVQEDDWHFDDFNCIDDGQGNIVYSLNTNATWLNINPVSGWLTGTPLNNHVGWFWVNITVNDGNGGIFSLNYTLTVTNRIPVMLTTPDQEAVEDQLHLDDFNCDDDNQGNVRYSFITNASWLSLSSPITGIMSGIPDNSHVGWYWVNVTVDDGNGGSDFINYTLTVLNVNDPPVITTLNVETAIEDELYEVDYNAIDIDPTFDILNWSLQTNASWLSLNITTGILNGTPSNGDIGYYWVNVSVNDSRGGIDYTNFTLYVEDANDPPIITTTNVEFAVEDALYSVDYEFFDIDDNVVTWTRTTNATWLVIDPITGNLSGIPENDDVGWFWVNVTVTDARGAYGYTNFIITVNNTPPLITNTPIEFINEDEMLVDDYNCSDDNQGNVIYSLVTNATWLNINSSTGVLNGTPNNLHVGWYWVNVTVDDGNKGVDYRYYMITVYNSLPFITTIPELNALEDSIYTQDFNCSDDGQGSIIYHLSTNATWLVLNDFTGVLSGTPLNEHVGSYWVNIMVEDGNGGVDSINYTLRVINTNDPPIITTGNVVFVEEDSYYFVDYEYIDVDKDSVAWILTTNATWLSIDRNTGVLYGTPVNAYVGWYYVNVSVIDGNGGLDYANFTLIVNNVNDRPFAPILLHPEDDSEINTTLPTFNWTASSDPDLGDHVAYYILQYSTEYDFSENLTTITGIVNISFTPLIPLEDKTTYYWRVEAFDSLGLGSGFQPHFVFRIDTGYLPPRYIGGLKSKAVKMGETWVANLDNFFMPGSITDGLIFTCNYKEVLIDHENHIATWEPRKKDAILTDVIITVYDGKTYVSSNTIDLSVEKGVAPPSIWERIFWPWSLIPMVLLIFLASAITYMRRTAPPFVESVFLIHEHSILITHASLIEEEEIDKDILSGMLTGVKNLISDAFARRVEGKEEETLKKLEFGDRNILLEKGYHFFIAVVFTGFENKDLLDQIDDVIGQIEEKYGHVLEDWDGDAGAFRGADKIIKTLLSTEKLEEEGVIPPKEGVGSTRYGTGAEGGSDSRAPSRFMRTPKGKMMGLTNGFLSGIEVGRRGMTNGFTNGLTNGLRTISYGITNGVTNGNGITNGLGARKKLFESKRSNWRLITVPMVILLLIFIPFIAVNFSESLEKIKIDGNFSDWGKVNKASDVGETLPFNQNVDIVDYGVDARLSELSFYMKVYSEMLAGEPINEGKHMDTAHIFIDTDQSQDTGYLVNGIGADFMVKVEGWSGEIYSQNLYAHSSDKLDWNLWESVGVVPAAVSGSELEVQIPFLALDINTQDALDVLFYMQSYDNYEDFSDTVISNEKGVLIVTQQGVGEGLISGIGKEVLRLDLSALEEDIEITGMKLSRTGKGSDSDVGAVRLMEGTSTITSGTLIADEVVMQTNILLEEGDSKTLYVEVDIGIGARQENSIGIRILKPHDITTSKGTITLRNSPSNAIYYDVSYINRVPADIKVDGAFADWENRDIEDDGEGEVNNNNLDIIEYGIVNSTDTISFYLRVDGELGWGTAVPYWNNGIAGNDSEPTEPVEPGPPEPPGPSLPPNKGEDFTYIYIDTDNSSTTGYLLHGIGADQLIEIKGKYGEVLSRKHLSFAGSSPMDWDWIHVTNVEVGKDTARLEVQMSKSDLDITGQFQVYFQTTDWSESERDYSDEGITRGIRGDFPINSRLFTITDNRRTRGNINVTSVDKAPPNIGWGDTTPTAMLRTELNEDTGPDDVILEQITITHLGTGESSDITVYIYEDVDEDDSFEPGGDDGSPLGSGTFPGNAVTINIADLTIAAGENEFIWIVYVFDTDSSDIGDTHGASIVQSSDLQVSAGDTVSGTFPQNSSETEIIPEFQEILIPSFMLIALFMVFKRKTKNANGKVQQ